MQDMNLQSKRHKRKHRRNENGIVIGSIILCLVTLTAITVCLIMVFRYRSVQMENTAVMNELEAIRMEEMVTYTQDEVDAMIANAVAENTDRTTEEVSKYSAPISLGEAVICKPEAKRPEAKPVEPIPSIDYMPLFSKGLPMQTL